MSESPEHKGLLLNATGVSGVGYMIMVTVSAADTQLFLVPVAMYAPDCAGVALRTTGFCALLLYVSGPVQPQVSPAESAVAKSLSVSPSQMGEVPDASTTGAAGSCRVTAAMLSEVQLLAAVTVILLYTAAPRLVIDIFPLASLNKFCGVWAILFRLKLTVYVVLADKPPKRMEPFVPAQVVGLKNVSAVMTGGTGSVNISVASGLETQLLGAVMVRLP